MKNLWIPNVKVIHWSLSKVTQISSIQAFLSTLMGPIKATFSVKPPRVGKAIFFKWSVSQPKWPPCPFMIKCLKIFFFGTLWSMSLKLGILHWALTYYKVCSNDELCWPLTFFPQRSALILMHVYEERLKWWITQKLLKSMILKLVYFC